MDSQSQENTQPGSPVHDEIIIEHSDSDQEADHVKCENEKNIKLIKSYENSAKLNISNNVNRSNNMAQVHQATLPRSKPTEWDIVTHIKLTHDVHIPPLPVYFRERESSNIFFCLSKSEEGRKEAYQKMVNVYSAWRKQFNKARGYENAVEDFDKHIANTSLVEENNVDVDQNEDDKPRAKTPDITDDNDFPTLGGKPSTSRNASIANKPSTQGDTVDVELDEFEEKDDPDDHDFVPSSQGRKKNNKKTVFKKATIFDFDDSATAWQSSKEVSSTSKGPEPKNNKNVPEPIVVEDKVDCPICNKPFPMSQIETHASDCLSFEDAVPLSSRTRTPVHNIEDAILISDDDETITKTSSNLPSVKCEHQTPKSTTKRLLVDEDDIQMASPTKKICPSSNV